MYQQPIGKVLAVDIGGTKTIAARVTDEGQIVNWPRKATAAAGLGIARYALDALEADWSSILSPHNLTYEQVFTAAHRNDPLAQEIVAKTARIIGISLANIISLVNPDSIILSGGIGMQTDLLLMPVRRVVGNQAQPILDHAVQIRTSQLGNGAGMLGAAQPAFDQTKTEIMNIKKEADDET
jgi:glucokinase